MSRSPAVMACRAVRRRVSARPAVMWITALVAALAFAAPAAHASIPSWVSSSGVLVFDDEFNSSGVNTSVWTRGWQHEGISGPMTSRCLSSNHVTQPGDGYLHLTVSPETQTCTWDGQTTTDQYTGGLVESNPDDGLPGHTGFASSSGTFVQWRVNVPAYVDGTNCQQACIGDFVGAWTLPSNHASEIDVLESFTNPSANLWGVSCGSIHPPFPPAGVTHCATHNTSSTGTWSGWHTFGADFEPGAVTFYYDDCAFGQVCTWTLTDSALTSLPQYLVMHIANSFLAHLDHADMKVDWVHVYRRPEPRGDFNGDGHADVMGVAANGDLLLFEGNGSTGWLNGGAGINVGNSWNTMSKAFSVGDFNSDGHVDVMGINSSGALLRYDGNGSGGWANANNPAVIGNGWGGLTKVFGVGDFNNDGTTDVMGIDGSGQLLLYKGDGDGNWLNGGSPVIIGTSWGGMTKVFGVGDFNGDNYADVMAVNSGGDLLLYEGNGTGGWLNGGNPLTIGNSWGGMTKVFGVGDFNSDSHADVMGVASNGALYLFEGNGSGGWLNGGAGIVVGNGWGGMGQVFGWQ